MQSSHSPTMKKRKRTTSQELEQDMIFEILLKLPLKSVVRFKALSKQWCNLITHSSFARAHLLKHPDNSSFIAKIHDESYPRLSIINVKEAEEACSRQRLFQPLTIPLPTVLELSFEYENCCDGILCFTARDRILLWNPITKWTKEINCPPQSNEFNEDLVGFGYVPSIKDFKVVRISSVHIEIMNLKSNEWRTASNVFPEVIFDKKVLCDAPPVYLNGNLYWYVVFESLEEIIISFDLNKEKLTTIQKPRKNLSASPISWLTTFRGKLCFVIYFNENFEILWMKEESNWEKVFEVNLPSRIPTTGDPIFPLCSVDDAIIFGIGTRPNFVSVDSEKRIGDIEITETFDEVRPIAVRYVGSLVSPNS